MTDDRQPPQDLAAEAAALGGMMLVRDVIPDVITTLGEAASSAFYRPAHQLIYDCIIGLHRDGQPTDAIAVAKALHHRGMLGRVGGAPSLHAIIASVPTAANAAYYAEIIAEKATLRHLIEAGTRIAQLGYTKATGDDVEAVVVRAREVLDEATSAVAGDAFEVVSLADLAGEPDVPEDWVVPDLLERGDRLILTGTEGLGKSVLRDQLALSVAGGIHPFTADPLKELDGGTQRVLIVDVENTRVQLKRRLTRIAATIDYIRRGHGCDPVDWGAAVRLVIRPDGVDLSRPRETAHLDAALAAMAPHLLVVGPLYKLTGFNTHEEEGALKLVQTLDQMRVKHRCALVMEHHTPHAAPGATRSTRPIGSSVFLRWPEFGLGLAAHPDGNPEEEHPSWVQVRRWRGSREIRDWPRELRHGGPDRLPWVPTEDYWDLIAKPTPRG